MDHSLMGKVLFMPWFVNTLNTLSGPQFNREMSIHQVEHYVWAENT